MRAALPARVRPRRPATQRALHGPCSSKHSPRAHSPSFSHGAPSAPGLGAAWRQRPSPEPGSAAHASAPAASRGRRRCSRCRHRSLPRRSVRRPRPRRAPGRPSRRGKAAPDRARTAGASARPPRCARGAGLHCEARRLDVHAAVRRGEHDVRRQQRSRASKPRRFFVGLHQRHDGGVAVVLDAGAQRDPGRRGLGIAGGGAGREREARWQKGAPWEPHDPTVARRQAARGRPPDSRLTDSG